MVNDLNPMDSTKNIAGEYRCSGAHSAYVGGTISTLVGEVRFSDLHSRYRVNLPAKKAPRLDLEVGCDSSS